MPEPSPRLYCFSVSLVKWLVRMLLKVNLYRQVPESLKNAKIPVLFLHGKADSTVSMKQAQANYDAVPGEKRLIPVEGAEHTLPLIVGGEKVQDEVIAFYDTWMKE